PADSPQAMTALVPPPLLDQLQALAQRDSSNIPAMVLHGAEYEGSVKDGNAEFKARFQIHCFSDRPTVVTVPLGGIELQEALLDGIFAYPVAQAAPQAGFALTVKGQGKHSLEVRFTARVVGNGEDRELRFGIPELHQSLLLLRVPAGAHYLQSVGGRGI